jgi:transglutaminase-like putative cysteine protease
MNAVPNPAQLECADPPAEAELAERAELADRAQPAPSVLRVQHDTLYAYDAPVELAHHLAWLRPRETAQQRLRGWTLDITPQPDVDAGTAVLPDVSLSQGPALDALALPTPAAHHGSAAWEAWLHGVHQSQDVWGNWRAGFFHARVHDRLEVSSNFIAELLPPPPLAPEASPAWETVAARLRYHPGSEHDDAMEFVLPTWYAPQDGALARFAREVFRPGTPLLVAAISLMHLVHRRFEYRPAATSVGTRATEAMVQQRGVCQDFAHVMIGAMRSIGLAARYVSGYLLTQPPPGQPRLIGADASHAWVQVWCPLHGWVALDPTNAVPAGTDHVTLAWGRDYADVAPLRGVIRGGGQAHPHVAVTVEPLGAAFQRIERRV